MDDFAVFSDDKLFLKKLRQKIELELEKYRLRIHPVKSQITHVTYGENFLGFRIFPNKIRVKSDNLRRARRRMKDLQDDYKNGLKGMDEIGQSIQSWVSHLNYGDTYRLRKDIFRNKSQYLGELSSIQRIFPVSISQLLYSRLLVFSPTFLL